MATLFCRPSKLHHRKYSIPPPWRNWLDGLEPLTQFRRHGIFPENVG
ncbi:rCG62913 [Rattus norvegicus]|uniref:RCG62913 n=1 Tax=Rattus norvegicus TaxID=10116 RepID=A6J3I6_RAT|nr:rCG62913 [Rattus norvegicus]